MFFLIVFVISLAVFAGVSFLSMKSFAKLNEGRSKGIESRVAILFAGLAALNVWNPPMTIKNVEGRKVVPPYLLYVFSYVVLFIISLIVIFTADPAYAILAIVFVAYVQSVNTRYKKIYPYVTPFAILFLTWFFYSPNNEILVWCDKLRDLYKIGLVDAKQPESYVIQKDTIFNPAEFLAITIGTFSMFMMLHSVDFNEQYFSEKDLPLSKILNPDRNGLEFISRFVGEMRK